MHPHRNEVHEGDDVITVTDIKQAIFELPEADYAELKRWFNDWEKWDQELENDADAGRLHWLVARGSSAETRWFDRVTQGDSHDRENPYGYTSRGQRVRLKRERFRLQLEPSVHEPPSPLVHRATSELWHLLEVLPEGVQRTARRNFGLLKSDPRHPSIQFKKVGSFWSARVGISHRALAIGDGSVFDWVWIGGHDEYERRIAYRR